MTNKSGICCDKYHSLYGAAGNGGISVSLYFLHAALPHVEA